MNNKELILKGCNYIPARFIKLPKDVLSYILSIVILEDISCILYGGFGETINWLCDERNCFLKQYSSNHVGYGKSGFAVIQEVSLIHPRIRTILKSQCVFCTNGWYFKRSFFDVLKKKNNIHK